MIKYAFLSLAILGAGAIGIDVGERCPRILEQVATLDDLVDHPATVRHGPARSAVSCEPDRANG